MTHRNRINYTLLLACTGIQVCVLHSAVRADCNPGSLFEAPRHFAAGNSPESLAVADFDGDGENDIAVANAGSDDVSVMLNDGNAGFQTATSWPTGTAPNSIMAADLNDDGFPDLAVTNEDSDNVSVLLGQGDGTFHAADDYSTGTRPRSVVARDFDHDSNIDLAVANFSGHDLTVLYGNGDGTYQPGVSVAASQDCCPFPASIAASDLERDGDSDFVVVNGWLLNVSTVQVVRGKGDGLFAQPQLVVSLIDEYIRDAALVDLNNDHVPDMVLAIYSASAGVMIGQGDGAFEWDDSYPVGEGAVSVDTCHLDNDNDLDLVVISFETNTVSVLRGNGDGTFTAHESYTVGDGPRASVAADLNGDGRPDLAVANRDSNDVSVLLNQCATCSADVDGSNAVDLDDLQLLLGAWGPCAACPEDLDGDGVVGVADLFELLFQWGPCS